MKAKLLKKMTVNGEDLHAGSIVDVSGWRNYRSLESMRYIAFIKEEELAETPKVEKPKAVKAKVVPVEPEIKEISIS
jgi:hypothetical protein